MRKEITRDECADETRESGNDDVLVEREMDCPVNDEVHAGKHGPEDAEQREEVDDVFLFGVPGEYAEKRRQDVQPDDYIQKPQVNLRTEQERKRNADNVRETQIPGPCGQMNAAVENVPEDERAGDAGNVFSINFCRRTVDCRVEEQHSAQHQERRHRPAGKGIVEIQADPVQRSHGGVEPLERGRMNEDDEKSRDDPQYIRVKNSRLRSPRRRSVSHSLYQAFPNFSHQAGTMSPALPWMNVSVSGSRSLSSRLRQVTCAP